MQTRSQKKITPAEEHAALEVLVKPKKPKKRAAAAADAAADIEELPPKKKARKKRSDSLTKARPNDSTPSSNHKARKDLPAIKASASPEVGAVSPKGKTRRKCNESSADGVHDTDVPSSFQTPGRTRSASWLVTRTNLVTSPPKAKDSRKRSPSSTDIIEDLCAPPAEKDSQRNGYITPTYTASNRKVPLPKDKIVREGCTPLEEVATSASSISPTKKPGRKRSASTVDTSADVTVPPSKRNKSPKAVRFENENLTPTEQHEEVDRLFQEDDTAQQTEDDILADFSGEKQDDLLKELDSEVISGGDLEEDMYGMSEPDNEEEEAWIPPEEEEEEADEQSLLEGGEETQGEEQSQPSDRDESSNILPSPVDKADTQLKGTTTTPSKPSLHPKDATIRSRYHALKKLAWTWTTTHFSHVSSINLSKLVNTSPQLMEYVNYISSCGPNTWEHVFANQRSWLIYCILGKTLEVHVFGHEMFGGSSSQLEQLQEMSTDNFLED
ncbi:hypothetical protein P7C71_g5366, partial [Lecanoromycetidae sp. Uapishka_2]